MVVRSLILSPAPRLSPRVSLTELLILVAVAAALVGVAVPISQSGIHWTRAAVREDLDTVRQAIALYESQNRPLSGTDLHPLIGLYLQEVPKDPWGNEYLVAADIGLVLTFGADAKPGGTDEASDIIVQFRAGQSAR